MKRIKTNFFISFFISIFVIAGLVIALAKIVKANHTALGVIILLITVISVIRFYQLKLKVGMHEKLLNDEYLSQYEKIKDGLDEAQIASSIKHEIKEEVLGTFIAAQTAGRTVSEVIPDAQFFTVDMIRVLTGTKRIALLSIIDGIILFIGSLLVVTIAIWLEQHGHGFFAVSIDVNLVVIIFFISFMIPLGKRTVGIKNRCLPLLPVAAVLLYVILSAYCRNFFSESWYTSAILDGSWRIIANTYILLGVLLLIPALYLIKYYMLNRSWH